jgi:hypothetical protein
MACPGGAPGGPSLGSSASVTVGLPGPAAPTAARGHRNGAGHGGPGAFPVLPVVTAPQHPFATLATTGSRSAAVQCGARGGAPPGAAAAAASGGGATHCLSVRLLVSAASCVHVSQRPSFKLVALGGY